MDDLKKLSDEALMENTESLVQKGNRITHEILRHFVEIERRKAYFTVFGKASMHEYAMAILKMDEGTAQRRITGTRALAFIPDVGEKIENATVSVSNLGAVEVFIRKEERLKGEKLSDEAKVELYQLAENTSTRKLEMKLAAISPEAVLTEKVKPAAEGILRLELFISEADLVTLTELRGMLAHSLNDPNSNSALLKKMIGIATEEVKRQRGKELKTPKPVIIVPSPVSEVYPETLFGAPAPVPPISPSESLSPHRSRHIPNETHRLVFTRAEHRCDSSTRARITVAAALFEPRFTTCTLSRRAGVRKIRKISGFTAATTIRRRLILIMVRKRCGGIVSKFSFASIWPLLHFS